MEEVAIKQAADWGIGFIDVGGDKDLSFHSSSLTVVHFNDLRVGKT
jgi:hypothetical protein